jgi:molybdopterin/thiamine biosynthesis adenylyltransferase
VRPWYERDPALLERELAAFAAFNIGAEVDEEARAGGLLRIKLSYPGPLGPVPLIATYPDFFPFFRPEVEAPGLNLTRHQNPIGGNLCLIGRRTSNWFAEESLAAVLGEQLPHLLEFAQTGDTEKLIPLEEPQGEPASVYYNWEAYPESYILVDGGWVLDKAAQSGTFVLRYEKHLDSNLRHYVQGYVERVLAEDGRELACWQGPRLGRFSSSMTGRWHRMPAPILGNIIKLSEGLGHERWMRLLGEPYTDYRRHQTIGAVVFPDETTHLAHVDGWGFILTDIPKAQKGRPRNVTAYFQKSARAGEADLAARSPASAAMLNSTVALIGLGAIGSHLAIELARCGVKELRLVDGDHMEPSTARRWAIGWPAFELKKAMVLADRLASDYPWTATVPFVETIGKPGELGIRRQGDTIEDVLRSVDLIIDTTAEMGVNHFLSELAKLRKIQYLLANATPGAWGGMVARFYPGGPCWMCFRTALYGDVEKKLPLPPADEGPNGQVQPAGCAEPTFTGTSFDLQEVTLETVRSAASMLGMAHGYASEEWQVAILSLRNGNTRTPPEWQTHKIPHQNGCRCADNS